MLALQNASIEHDWNDLESQFEKVTISSAQAISLNFSGLVTGESIYTRPWACMGQCSSMVVCAYCCTFIQQCKSLQSGKSSNLPWQSSYCTFAYLFIDLQKSLRE